MKLPFLQRRRARDGWLVVSLAQGNARFAHVRAGNRPAVVSLAEREWDPQDSKALERVTKELQATRYRCSTVLSQSDYQMLLVESPGVKREELKSAVRWRIKDMIDYPVLEATLD